MTERDPDRVEAMREVAREVLREVVPEILAHAGARAYGSLRTADADAEAVPQVPPPPVAAVLRPSTWAAPAAPGEVIGDRAPESDPPGADVMHVKPHISAQGASGAAPGGPEAGARVEVVSIDTDEDLERFVRALLARVEDPREWRAVRAGRVRFALRRAPGAGAADPPPAARFAAGAARPAGAAPAALAAPGGPKPVLRLSKGAVTERAVRDAADRGVRLVLARGAVLTPLARDQARVLGVEIEKEGRC